MQNRLNFSLNQLGKKFAGSYSKVSNPSPNFSFKIKHFLSNLRYKARYSKRNPAIYLGLGLVFVFLITVLAARIILGGSFGDDRISPPEAIASQQLNKSFAFPIRDGEGNVVELVSYEIERASLQNSFIYQGKLAKSVKGRTFLIFDLKITNPYSKAIQINTRDYIRIKVNNSKELLAPEIHNDPVEIQAKSTKFTRIGMPINESDREITIFIGELQGKKQEIKLNF